MATTDPIDERGIHTAPRLTIAPAWVDPSTGQTYIHRDMVSVEPDWNVKDRIAPINTTEQFGDVESWCLYVNEFGSKTNDPMLTWSEDGLLAILDYHVDLDEPGRCTWRARHSFERSHQWKRWMEFANGTPRSQKVMLEALENFAEDVQVPAAPVLLNILRTLRATSNAKAEVEIRPDGTSKATFTKDNAVKSGEVDLPSEFRIRIPVLKGHTELKPVGEGPEAVLLEVPVLYELSVRVRVSVDDNAQLMFRLVVPNAVPTLEAVFADRVAAARRLLGEDKTLYRAAK